MTLLALQQDIAFSDGKVGDYLFMGNMVYTVSLYLVHGNGVKTKFMIIQVPGPSPFVTMSSVREK